MMDRKAKQMKLRERHLRGDRQRRIDLLIEKGLIKNAKEIPDEAIPVDANCSTTIYGLSPRVYYADTVFACSDCGEENLWSAVEQQYYFEVIKASMYKKAKRCLRCRQALRARNEPKG